MRSSEIIESLRQALDRELPGIEAQLEMASSRRLAELADRMDLSNARRSSVLIPIFEEYEKLGIIFMKRPEYEGVHSGQISFPGGRVEPEDKSLVDTALREAREEVNIHQHQVDILGKMTKLFIPPSNFLVQPVVGFLKEEPELIPQPGEVEEILKVPLDFFLDESNRQTVKVKVYGGYRIETPAYIFEDKVIWGATAMILAELLHLFRSL